jgi:hypothetical protein
MKLVSKIFQIANQINQIANLEKKVGPERN